MISYMYWHLNNIQISIQCNTCVVLVLTAYGKIAGYCYCDNHGLCVVGTCVLEVFVLPDAGCDFPGGRSSSSTHQPQPEYTGLPSTCCQIVYIFSSDING